MTPEQVCDDVRRAIALRTQACTADPALANARLDAAGSLHCKLTTVADNAYQCSAVTLARSCDEVKTLGDDMASWVSQPPCDALFGPAGSGGAAGAAGSSGGG